MVNWDEQTLRNAFESCFGSVNLRVEQSTSQRLITSAQLARWFSETDQGRPTYAQRLAASLDSGQIDEVKELYLRQLTGQSVPWRAVTAYLVAAEPRARG